MHGQATRNQTQPAPAVSRAGPGPSDRAFGRYSDRPVGTGPTPTRASLQPRSPCRYFLEVERAIFESRRPPPDSPRGRPLHFNGLLGSDFTEVSAESIKQVRSLILE